MPSRLRLARGISTRGTRPANDLVVATDLPRMLRRVWIAAVLLTLISVALSVTAYCAHWNNAFYLVLSPAGENFTDFTMFKQKFELFHSAAFFTQFYPYSYPAPLALTYKALYLLGDEDLGTFLAITALAVVVPAILFARALVRRGIGTMTAYGFAGTLLLCSWPAWLIFDRANVEIFVWIALAAAIWAFATGRLYSAAVLFGVAASFKLFPFIFLGLFLSMRRWKPLLAGIASFVAVSWLSLAILGPTVPVAYRGIQDGLQWFSGWMMAYWRPWESGVDHSLFALVKFIEIQLLHHPPDTPFFTSLTVYTRVTAIMGLLLYGWRIRRLPLLNQVLIFSIACIFLTAFSGDGTLIHLYSSLALLAFVAIDAARRGVTVAGLGTALLLLAFLVSFESFFVLRAQSSSVLGQTVSFIFQGQRWEGQAKCVALAWLLVVALRYPFGPPLAREERPDALAWPDASAIGGQGRRNV